MTEPVSPLRQRMIDDMKLRNMSRSSQQIYTSPREQLAAS